MTREKFGLCALSLAMLLNTACSQQRNEDDENLNSKNPNIGEIVHVQRPACYLNACFDTTPFNKITDPAKDYVYPDPRDFDDVDMRPHYFPPVAILELKKIDGNQKISPHFIFKDFMSTAKGAYGLFSSDVINNVEFIRNYLNVPVTVTSGYRSPGYNRRTSGSAAWSRHTYGDAVDIQARGVPISTLAKVCDKFGGFPLEYTAHVHCDWRAIPSDLAFFDVQRIAIDQRRDYSVAQKISQDSRIFVSDSGATKSLSVELAINSDDADEGELIYLWQINFPDGTVQTFSSPRVELNAAPGTYSVAVTVGGSIHISDNFTW